MSSDTPFDHLEQCWRVDVYLVDVAPPRLLDLEQLLMDEPILLLLLVGLREMILKSRGHYVYQIHVNPPTFLKMVKWGVRRHQRANLSTLCEQTVPQKTQEDNFLQARA